MASLTRKPNGSCVIGFTDPDGRPRWLYTGKMSRRAAETILRHVETMLAAKVAGAPMPVDTAGWLATIGDTLYGRLAGVGLVRAREAPPVTKLGPFVRDYIDRRTDLKERTLSNLEQSRTALIGFFGEGRDVSTITKADASDFRRKMASAYAGATVAMFVKKARQFFADAVDRELIARNPFKAVKAASMVNAARNVYVPAADVERVIAACPDVEWKLIFALCRYAGLRMPSEVMPLTWADVDWGSGFLTVRSPKTEHIEGKAERQVPVMPALLSRLVEAANAAGEGATHLITTNRIVKPNTRGAKIVRRAGLTPWPRLFQNLRASCETDFASVVPIHVACEWIGNSQMVAARHYLKVTAEHVEAARRGLAGAANGARPLQAESRPFPEHRPAINQTTPLLGGVCSASIPPRGVDRGPETWGISLVGLSALNSALHAPPADTAAVYLHTLSEQIYARAAARAEGTVARG